MAEPEGERGLSPRFPRITRSTALSPAFEGGEGSAAQGQP